MERIPPITSTLVTPEGTVHVSRMKGDLQSSPLIYVSAWGRNGSTNTTYADGIRAADPNQSVLTYEVVKPGKAPGQKGSRIGPAIRRNGEVLWHVVKAHTSRDEGFKIVAQSLGATTLFASLDSHPEILQRIKAAILVSPAAMFLSASEAQLYWRFLLHNAQSAIDYLQDRGKNSYLRNNWQSTFWGLASNPTRLAHAISEARDLAHLAMYGNLTLLTNAGIPTGIILFEKDKLFPANQILGKLETDTTNRPILVHLGKGGHNPISYLTPAGYGALLMEMFAELEAGPNTVTTPKPRA